MRLYIGSYDEDKVDTVIQDLRKAGIKSELKPSLDAELQAFYFIEGKLGELKDKYKDDIISKKLKDIETKFDVARSIMKDGINVRDFEEIFLDKVLPERKKYEEIKKRLKEGSNKEKSDDKISEDEFDEKELNNFIDYFYEELELMSDFHSMLEMNGIRYDDEDKMYGKIDENPYIKMYIDVDGGQAEELELKKEFETLVGKNIDVYANLIDVIYEIEKVEELCKNKPEYSKLLFMIDIVSEIIRKIEGKIDIDKLTDEIKMIEDKNIKIYLTPSAIKEILKTMEKAEIIKIKNGKVMLRKK